jgi:hypothetical protein
MDLNKSLVKLWRSLLCVVAKALEEWLTKSGVC